MEEERLFPLPEKGDLQNTAEEPHAGFKSLSDVSCRMSPSLKPCFLMFMSFIPLFLCYFLTARSVTLGGHTKSGEVFSNLGHITLKAPSGVRGQLRLSGTFSCMELVTWPQILGHSSGTSSLWTQCWTCNTLRP